MRCEIEHAARREMVVKLDDFLRRRSKISLVVSRDTLQSAQGLTDACRILFGDQAEARLEEYFRETEAEAIPREREREIEVEAQHAAS